MNLRKLPPSMLLALGLSACVDDSLPASGSTGADSGSGSPPGADTTGNIGATSSVSITSTSSTSGLTTSTSEMSTSPCLDVDIDVGPCLVDIGNIPDMGNMSGTTTGPCLEPPSDTGFESSSGSDSGSGTGTSGGMEAPPSDSRSLALERMLSRGVLPPDVAARLRRTSKPGKG